MDRIDAIPRSEKTQHKGHPTYDIFHVWANGHVRDGVRYTSTLHVWVAEPGHPDALVGLWVPGTAAGERQEPVAWGQDFYMYIREFGMVAVVSFNDVPLRVFWELSVGKAPDVQPVSDRVQPPVVDRIPEPVDPFGNVPTFRNEPPPPFQPNRPSVRVPGIDD